MVSSSLPFSPHRYPCLMWKFLEGDALSVYTARDGRTWVILTPFVLPNELVRVKLDRSSRLHSKSELLEVLEKNEELRLKEGEGVNCKYFGKWSVCPSLCCASNSRKLKRRGS